MNREKLTALELYIKQNKDPGGTVRARRAHRIMRSLGSATSQEPWRCPLPTCRGTREFDGRAHHRRKFWVFPKGRPKPYIRAHYFERCECTIEEVCIALGVSDGEWFALLQPRESDERRPRTPGEIENQRIARKAVKTVGSTSTSTYPSAALNNGVKDDEA